MENSNFNLDSNLVNMDIKEMKKTNGGALHWLVQGLIICATYDFACGVVQGFREEVS